MFRTLCGIAVAMMVSVVSVVAQEQLAGSRPHTAVVGLPILSSDGEKIGQITGVEGESDQVVLVGEIDRQMGMGSDEVAIPAGVYVDRGDHIELTVTATDVRNAIAKAGR